MPSQESKISYVLLTALIIGGAQASCALNKPMAAAATPVPLDHIARPQKRLPSTPSPLSAPDSAIRKVDFRNFTFPDPEYGYLYERVYTEKGIGHYRSGAHTTHKLIEGKESLIEDKEGLWRNDPVGLGSVAYADVTGDGKEEALIELGISVRGSAIPTYLYVYTWEKTKNRRLLAFAAGDRADGGFRRIYADKSELIIELNAGDENAPNCDGCRATRFARLRYKWSRYKFVLLRSEILPISSKIAQ